MKRKLNIQLMGIAAIAIISTLIMTVTVFYNLFREQVMDDLENYAYLLENTFEADSGMLTAQLIPSSIRVTVIDNTGMVIFDNDADANSMTNHLDRPEVQEALKNGEGRAIRRSDTMNKDTFYYAVRVNDGYILRVASEAGSIWSLFEKSFPIIALIILPVFVLCIVLSHILTNKILRPIKNMANNMEDALETDTYKELVPFIETINKQHEDIVKSAKVRQEFTANVSHELKTPLTVISGYSELIENGMAEGEDVMRFANEIHHNSDRLLTLINDIIRLSELDSEEYETVYEEVDLYDEASRCVSLLKMNAGKHNVSLDIYGSKAMVYGNKMMIQELLFNLCDNAIRYNKENGSVKISICEDETDVSLVVEDTGIGIRTEEQNRVFERFYRVDKSRSKATGGTGLGLAIVKHIVSKHRADLELESALSVGTKITIRFHKQ